MNSVDQNFEQLANDRNMVQFNTKHCDACWGLRCEEKEDDAFAMLTDSYYNYSGVFSVMQK